MILLISNQSCICFEQIQLRWINDDSPKPKWFPNCFVLTLSFRSLLLLLFLLLLLPGRSGCWHTPHCSAVYAVSFFLPAILLGCCYQSMFQAGCVSELVWSGGGGCGGDGCFLIFFSSILGSKRCRKCVLSCFVITSVPQYFFSF